MQNSYTGWAWPWWTVMVLINAVNLGVCAMVYRRSLIPADGRDSAYRKRMRLMGVIFTLVGAYRAIFVSRYLTQVTWFDSLANSALLIRIFAMAAELSFSGLIALAMLRVNTDVPACLGPRAGRIKSFLLTKSPYALWGYILLAQFFATNGLITKRQTSFAIEETLWAVGFLAVLPLSLIQLHRVSALKAGLTAGRIHLLKKFTRLNAAWCALYCSYGVFYHLPFESWAVAINQIKTGLPIIKTGSGTIADAFMIVNASKAFSDYGFGFLLWHSTYFSICVWMAIFLMQAPRLLHHAD